jgi:hypothetical protein
MIQGEKDYKLVDASAYTQQQIEDECNNQVKNLCMFHSAIMSIGALYFEIS